MAQDAAVTVTLLAGPQIMRVDVSDRGVGLDPEGAFRRARRLRIADRCGARTWLGGVEHDTGTTTVWFEVDGPQREAPLDPDPFPPG